MAGLLRGLDEAIGSLSDLSLMFLTYPTGLGGPAPVRGAHRPDGSVCALGIAVRRVTCVAGQRRCQRQAPGPVHARQWGGPHLRGGGIDTPGFSPRRRVASHTATSVAPVAHVRSGALPFATAIVQGAPVSRSGALQLGAGAGAAFGDEANARVGSGASALRHIPLPVSNAPGPRAGTAMRGEDEVDASAPGVPSTFNPLSASAAAPSFSSSSCDGVPSVSSSGAGASAAAVRRPLPIATPIALLSKIEVRRLFPRVENVAVDDGRGACSIHAVAVAAAHTAAIDGLPLERDKDKWPANMSALALHLANLARSAPEFEVLASRTVERSLAGCLMYAPAALVTGLCKAVEVAQQRKGGMNTGAGDPSALALDAMNAAHCKLTEADFVGGAPHFSLVYMCRVELPVVVVLAEAQRVHSGDRRSRQIGQDLPQGFVVALASACAKAYALVRAGRGLEYLSLVYVGQELRAAT